MTRIFLILALFLSFGIMITSCTPDEGYGGTASIRGNIQVHFYDTAFQVLQWEQPAQDESVFINFGGSTTVGDEVETSYTGDFLFDQLFPGTYTIYYYSQDPESGHREKVEKTYELSLKNGQETDLGQLILYDTRDWDEGYATIHGQILQVNYREESVYPDHMLIQDTIFAQELEVYLVHGNHGSYDERIRTHPDGTFTFPNLLKGSYRIYFYSDNLNGSNESIPIELSVLITNDFETVDLGIHYINHL